MALVFVHGVATRRDSDYERGITARDALFRRYVYPVMNWDSNARPFNAYWGDAAAKFRWDHRSLPQDSVEAFGTAGQEEDWLLAEAAAGTEIDTVAPVAAIARRSVEDAVDLIWATAAQDIEGDADAEALALLAFRISSKMGTLASNVALTTAHNDDEWLTNLIAGVEKSESSAGLPVVETFGGRELSDQLSESLIRLRNAAGRISGTAATKLLRARLHRQMALFIGDVFTYLDRRGDVSNPGPIVESVAKTIDDAIAADGPLVIVAHSMGGPIVYDLLSYYRTDIKVAKLITVGSQVGLFEELCLLQKGKNDKCPPGPAKVASLANVTEWINIFDSNDLLAFVTEPIFNGAEDFSYTTGRGLFAAHSAYFTMPSFYRRLADRVKI